MTVPHYVTNDPYLASFVLSEGAVLAGCQRLGPKKVEFRFEADRHLHESLRIYWSALPVPVVPARLYAALRMLKSRTLVQPGFDTRQTTIAIRSTQNKSQGAGTVSPSPNQPC